ncbi:MAG: sugar O-acetyltransferase [Oscillospiraceae bacterium]|nr:sugar O-acetyltransferase [Oscillospiraceae bacterium]
MNNRDKLHTGDLYTCADEELAAAQRACLELQYDYNATRPSEGEKREELLKKMFAEIGEGCYIEPPLHSNWGGHHTHLGKGVYANFALTLVDDTHIYIGDYTMIGPNVVLATAGHPVLPALREKVYQYNLPIHIGRNCWLGAGVVVLPGVTIGDNTVIGAGSIVTRDIPANVVAYGNPCRVVRPIDERDLKTYFRGRPIDPADLAAVGIETE